MTKGAYYGLLLLNLMCLAYNLIAENPWLVFLNLLGVAACMGGLSVTYQMEDLPRKFQRDLDNLRRED